MLHSRTGAPTTLILLAIIVGLSCALAYTFATRPSAPAGTFPDPTANIETTAVDREVPLAADADCPQCVSEPQPNRYTRSTTEYAIPAVTLVDADGRNVALSDELNHDDPVMMQFIFTTCPTICPIMSATFAAVGRELPPDLKHVRMVSISIDPEHDTAARLKQYAADIEAGPHWHFLTGTRGDIAAVQKAFDAYQDSKMQHAPLTFLRSSSREPWVRIDGLLNATELIAELAQSQQGHDPDSSLPPTVASAGAATSGDPALGRRIYHEGVLPSGEPLRATTLGSVTIEASHIHCASCHRDSGFAGGEETVYVPPITGPVLYQQRELHRGVLFRKLFQDVQPNATTARVQDGRYRPAYTDASLAAAIRHGQDPTGRELGSLMPRYELGDADVGHLVAYLKTLHDTPAPGVEDSTIHFATVVTDGSDPDQRAAMLGVLEAYVRRKNTDTRGKLLRPGFSPLYKNEFKDSFRYWDVHVWELTGAPETWPAQLEAYYQERPVFALLSGLSGGRWQPIHEFCERNAIPCLFPNTDLPVVSEVGDYTLYFSKGLALEAEVAASHLRTAGQPDGDVHVLQVYRDHPRSKALADHFADSLPDDGPIHLQQHVLSGDSPPPRALWSKVLTERSTRPSVVALWLEQEDLEQFPWDDNALPAVSQIYLSCGLTGGLTGDALSRVQDKLRMTYPYALPGQEPPRIYRIRAWLRSRRIEMVDQWRVQLSTYFALSLADHALVHLVHNFNRDYLIESVEHETEKGLNPGVFPHLSLGPGQRFASKGAYLVRPRGAAGDVQAISDWLVP